MNTIDIIYIIAIVVASVVGYISGFLSRVSTIVGVVFGLFNAMAFHGAASAMLQEKTGWEELPATVVAYAALFILSFLAVKLIAATLKQFLELLHLGIINKLAGALFSALITFIIVTSIIDVSSTLMPENKYTGKTVQQESLLYNKIAKHLYKEVVTRLF
ncbi:MAG: CvpA family protein [Bacteroidaceae bacterium]|nr:CvpA family protein [Bacteroidaceae bacterium]